MRNSYSNRLLGGRCDNLMGKISTVPAGGLADSEKHVHW